MAELSVQIGADIQDLLRKLNLTEKEFKKLALEAAKTGKTVEQVLKESGKGGKAFQQGTQLASKGMADLGKSTANAVPTLTSFSQVIQDAPYGIRGVANNITQLTSQFGYLSKSSGGAGGALKAMLGTLAGPAGILLAVSAVTSLLVSYGDEIANIIKGNDALAASQKEVNKALNEFYGDQVTKINTYVSILEDVNTSETQRKEITDELIKTVPSLTKADFAYGNNLDIVKEKIGQYVLAQASRIEADTLVAENAEKLAQKARITQIKSIDDTQKRIQAFEKFLKDEGENLTITKFDPLGGTQKTFVLPEAEIVKRFNEFANELDKDLAPVQERINELYGITFGGGGTKIDDSKIKGQFEKLKEAQSILKKQLEDSILTKGKDNVATKELAAGYKLLTDEINKINDVFKKPKDNSKKLLEAAEKQRAFLIGLENDVNDYRVEKAKETFAAVDAIVAGSINKLVEGYEIDPFAGLGAAINNVDKDITNLENKIKDTTKNIQNGLSRIGFDPDQFNLDEINLEQLNLLERQLRTIGDVSNVIGSAVGNSIGTMVDKMAEEFSTGNELIDSFVGTLLNAMAQLLTQLITQQIAQTAAQTAIASASAASEAAVGTARAVTSGLVAKAQGVQIATSAAAALGPFGIAALPGLIAGVQAQILGALAIAKIPAFAQGGYTSAEGKRDKTGFRVAGIVHEGEYVVPKKVLQTKAGAQMVNKLEDLRKYNRTSTVNNFTEGSFASGGFTSNNFANKLVLIPSEQSMNALKVSGMSNITNNPITNNVGGDVYGEVILRGTNQVIQLRRSEKKMNRFYSS